MGRSKGKSRTKYVAAAEDTAKPVTVSDAEKQRKKEEKRRILRAHAEESDKRQKPVRFSSSITRLYKKSPRLAHVRRATGMKAPVNAVLAKANNKWLDLFAECMHDAIKASGKGTISAHFVTSAIKTILKPDEDLIAKALEHIDIDLHAFDLQEEARKKEAEKKAKTKKAAPAASEEEEDSNEAEDE